MKEQESYHYERIAKAIAYISANHKLQPDLETIAEQVHLSPAHFQRLFTAWAGTSPKRFLQYISLDYAKSVLAQTQGSIFQATHEAGLSSTSRLHDLFVQIEGMTPAQYKNNGKGVGIRYSFRRSPFGELITASTDRGLCYMAFGTNRNEMLQALKARFPMAQLSAHNDDFQQRAVAIFEPGITDLKKIKLHLKGSDFQLKVWESLLRIPFGSLSTYGALAKQMGSANAARAVGTAIGSNPVAFLIPCHRVIQATGAFGGYMWGTTRKKALIGWEAAQLHPLK